MMRLGLFLVLLFLTSLSAKVEKDLNLAVLKKAHHWLVLVAEEENSSNDKLKECTDLTNVENTWDTYKDLMKQSVVLIRKYPRKVVEKLSELLTVENKDILPLVAFYMYTTERKDKTFRYYDAFKVVVVPANQENLWVALIPFTDTAGSKQSNYSVLIMDLNNNRILVKD
jgi:hypothetical protein